MNNKPFYKEVVLVLKKAISAIFLFAVITLFSGIANADVPEWLRSLAKQPAKSYADDVNAVVLLDDHITTVRDNGELVKRGRRAVRVLRPAGRVSASVYAVSYNGDSKINYLRGWSITSQGQEYETKPSDVMERSISTYEIYSDAKVKAIHVPGADVGTVMGFEYEQQEHPYIFQDEWWFQESEPVEQSRYELHLASGWRFKSDWLNHKQEKAIEENGALLWQLTNIQRIEREPNQPPSRALAASALFTFLSDKMP